MFTMIDGNTTGPTALQAQRQGTRSRWGCLNCRKRRKKCDEARPACQICITRGVECEYPDWTMVKYSQTRHRKLQHEDASSPSTRPTLLPQPSSTETRLVYHFNTIVTSLITFSSSQPGVSNPFVLHVLPRVSDSMQVQRAVEAVAAAHLHHLGGESQEHATLLHSHALHLLAIEISRPDTGEMSRMNMLAGSLLLIYYEIVLGNSASNAWCHLQGAKILLDYHWDTPETPCFAFFCKVFQYFNVMLALSMRTRPLSINSSHNSISIDDLDTVFGCTARLWPLMHRLADIVGRLREGEEMTREARALAASLEAWSIETSPTADAYLEAMFQIARAYKYCGLLVLGTSLRDYCPGETTGWPGEIYQAAFESVLRVCVLSTPMSTLTWPLYVVGKLATSTSDRTVIMHIFSHFLEKHHMKVVEGARNAVAAYWRQGERDLNWEPPAPVLLG